MFAKLKGTLEETNEDSIIIDVNGVGYLVNFPSKIIPTLVIGSNIALYIDTIVREDSITLFGFRTRFEQQLFRMLIDVKGVGGKLALNILGHGNGSDLVQHILVQDTRYFKAISGVGPKLAERIIIECKGKASKIVPDFDIIVPNEISGASNDRGKYKELVSALENLGFQRMEAANVAKKIVEDNDNIEIGSMIRIALKELAK